MAKFKSWARRNMTKAHAILACSNEIAMLESGYFRVHPDRITILAHAFSRLADEGLQRRSGSAQNADYLIVGNVEYLKALDLMLQGFSAFLRSGGKGRLLLAGCAGLHEVRRQSDVAAFQPVIERFVSEHGPEAFQFLGKKNKSELAQLRAQVAAVVIGSRFESLTMVAGEAFLSGCPLILSDHAGWRALAERFQAARLINPYDPDDVAAAMREMASNDIRARYRRGGDALAEHLTSPELARRTSDFYRRVAV
jgi:glycosyltransferase involved in cell wall biosynthesis